jgi:hypothetical protein
MKPENGRAKNMKKFARLEEVDGRQILAEIFCASDKEGPKLRIRRDMSVSMELTLGPWGTGEKAWEKALEELEGIDMQLAAQEFDELLANLAEQPLEA